MGQHLDEVHSRDSATSESKQEGLNFHQWGCVANGAVEYFPWAHDVPGYHEDGLTALCHCSQRMVAVSGTSQKWRKYKMQHGRCVRATMCDGGEERLNCSRH